MSEQAQIMNQHYSSPTIRGGAHSPDAELVCCILQSHALAQKGKLTPNQAHAAALHAKEILVRRYEQPLFGTLFKITHSREDAEDLTQEAFVRAFQKLDSYDTSRPFKPWLFRLAVNLGISALRKRKGARSLDDEEDFIPLESAESGEALRASLDCQSRLQLVRKALAQLPPETQVIFQLHYHDGITLEDIAKMLDKKPGAIRTAVHRARTKVREWFSDNAPHAERPET
ncbi:MAG: RNA polymerase sigma factor [Sumerlaeia bacterium]